MEARSLACAELAAWTMVLVDVLWVVALVEPVVVASVTAEEPSES